MSIPLRRMVLFVTNCGKADGILHYGNSPWSEGCVTGPPLPTELCTVGELIERDIVGLYKPVTKEEIVRLRNDLMFFKRELHVFDWIGDYPDPQFYSPQVLFYPPDYNGNSPVGELSKEDYKKFVDRHVVLPACTYWESYVGLYKERVKLRSE